MAGPGTSHGTQHGWLGYRPLYHRHWPSSVVRGKASRRNTGTGETLHRRQVSGQVPSAEGHAPAAFAHSKASRANAPCTWRLYPQRGARPSLPGVVFGLAQTARSASDSSLASRSATSDLICSQRYRDETADEHCVGDVEGRCGRTDSLCYAVHKRRLVALWPSVEITSQRL
jgi:hypothetical protein